METESLSVAEKSKPKLRWYRFRLRMLLLVLTIIAVAFYVSLLCGLESAGPFSVSVGIVVITCIVCVGYLGYRVAEHYRFQYSLRSLFILTTLVAIGMSWLTVTMQRQRREFAAAEAIKKMGGIALSGEPTWLGKLLRDDSLVSVTYVDLQEKTVTDAWLVHLHGLDRLRWLTLDSTKVTDAALVRLQGLRQLDGLSLNSTKVTDAGLAHLQGMGQLEYLSLEHTQITDAGLLHLHGLSQLHWLNLYDTKVTDEGAKKLQQALPNCRIQR
jgi:hypothetical protein